MFLPASVIDGAFSVNQSSLEIKNYSSIFKYSSIGGFHGVVMSLVFYSARLFSSWLCSLAFSEEQTRDPIKITENFTILLMTFVFFQFLDFYKLIFLFQNVSKFNVENAQAGIYNLAELCFYAAFGFFVFYTVAHVALYFVAIVVNRYLKNFFTGEMVSALNFSVLIMILSLSLYPMSSEIARLIEVSFELIKK